MKRNVLILAAAVLLFSSCATNYVVTDHVSRRLDGTRTLLTSDSSAFDGTPYALWQHSALDRGQVFDFRTKRDTMRYAFSQAIPRDGWTITHDSLPRMLRPQVTVSKQFLWFTTRYRYTAVFPALDSLPVPVSQYLTPDEQRLLFQPLDLPADWNGADMYALLDKLNTKYIKWWSHCVFEKEYEDFYASADSVQRLLLAQYHDTLLALVQADLDNDSQQPLARKASLFPELAFVSDYNRSLDVLGGVGEWYETMNGEVETRALWRVELPGGRTAEYMVSLERLINGDYTVSLDSHVLNWWAVAATFLLLAVLVFILPRRRFVR